MEQNSRWLKSGVAVVLAAFVLVVQAGLMAQIQPCIRFEWGAAPIRHSEAALATSPSIAETMERA
jgi:hypothetical protein